MKTSFECKEQFPILSSASCSHAGHNGASRTLFSLLLVMALQVLFGITGAYASNVSCNANTVPNYSPVLGSTSFPRNAPIGSTTQNYSSTLSFHCQADTGADRDIFLAFAATPTTPVSGYTDVYATNVPGVGVRYTISNGAGTACKGLPVTVKSGSTSVTCHQLQAATVDPGYNYSLTVSAQFVKTANGTAGTLATIPALSVTNSVNNQSGTFPWGNIFSGSASGAFANLACTVTTPAVQVAMPQANTKDLPSVGSTTGSTSLNVGLTCDAGVRVFATLSDVTVPSNTSTTLSLTADSTAQGIGYQILYSGSPVAFGADSAAAGNANQFAVTAGQTGGGVVDVPLTARYIRTGVIRAGSANAKATITMSYQ